MNPLQHFNPRGRIGRLAFLRALGVIALGLVFLLVALSLVITRRYYDVWDLLEAGELGSLAVLLVLFAYLCVQQIRRLHDLGTSGGWLVLAYGLPFALAFALEADLEPVALWTTLQVFALMGLFGVLAWALLGRGEPAPNRFGAPPADALPAWLARQPAAPQPIPVPGDAAPLPIATPTRTVPGMPPANHLAMAREPVTHVMPAEVPESTTSNPVAPAASSSEPAAPSRGWWHMFSLAGRYSRADYVLHVGLALTLAVILGVFCAATFGTFPDIMLPPALLLAWYAYASTVKRLHDANWSNRRVLAWTALVLFAFIGYPMLWLFNGVGFMFHPFAQHLGVLQAIGAIALVWGAAVCLFRASCPHGNAYGPVP